MSGLSHIGEPARTDNAVEYAVEVERLAAELADVRADLAIVEQERDELRGAVIAHRSAIWRSIGRPGSKMDRDLWEVLR